MKLRREAINVEQSVPATRLHYNLYSNFLTVIGFLFSEKQGIEPMPFLWEQDLLRDAFNFQTRPNCLFQSDDVLG